MSASNHPKILETSAFLEFAVKTRGLNLSLVSPSPFVEGLRVRDRVVRTAPNNIEGQSGPAQQPDEAFKATAAPRAPRTSRVRVLSSWRFSCQRNETGRTERCWTNLASSNGGRPSLVEGGSKETRPSFASTARSNHWLNDFCSMSDGLAGDSLINPDLPKGFRGGGQVLRSIVKSRPVE